MRDWLRGLIGRVPPDIEVCEFRCSRTSCRHGDWERCDWRLHGGVPSDLPGREGQPPASAGEGTS